MTPVSHTGGRRFESAPAHPGGSGMKYEERAPISRGVVALLLAGVSAALLGTLLSLAGVLEAPPVPLAGAAFLLGLAAASFAGMRFRAGSEHVEAWMFPVRYRVGYGEVEGVDVVELPWYWGWGLRVLGRRLAFVSRHGRAVRIRKRQGVFRELLLTVREPERFAELVRLRAHAKA